MSPKVSICISVYNHEKYISDCLSSIVTQLTDFEFEVILGEDCSTDQSRHIITQFANKYPNIIKPVFYEKNIGPAANYYHLHSITQGEYVAHCDGDDLFLPEKLQKQVDFLDAHPDYTVVWHKSIYFDDSGHTDKEYRKNNVADPGETITLEYVLRNGTVATHSSCMYRKSAKKTYNPSFEALDVFFAIEFLMSGKGMILNDELSMYRVMSNSSVSKGKKGTLIQRELVIHHWNYYRTILPQYRSQMFIFSTIGFLIDLKNKRRTAWGFLKIMFLNFGLFNISEMIESFNNTRFMRVPVSFFQKK